MGPDRGPSAIRWLSPEWFDRSLALAEAAGGYDGLSARIQCEITGGPDGDVSCYWVIEGGRLTEGAGGTVGLPDVTLTLPWDDAVASQRGALDPSVAFMQGRLKVTGSMGTAMALLAVSTEPGCRDLRRRMAEITRF